MINNSKNSVRKGYKNNKSYNGVIKHENTNKFRSFFNDRLSSKAYDTAKDAAKSYDMRVVDNQSSLSLNFEKNREKYKKELGQYSKKRKRISSKEDLPEVKKQIITEYTKRTIAFSQKWTCNLCNTLLDPSFDIDHIIPFQFGGSDTKNNYHALCVRCHRYKTHSIDSKILRPMLNGKHDLTSDDILRVIKKTYNNEHMSVTKKRDKISFEIDKNNHRITVSY